MLGGAGGVQLYLEGIGLPGFEPIVLVHLVALDVLLAPVPGDGQIEMTSGRTAEGGRRPGVFPGFDSAVGALFKRQVDRVLAIIKIVSLIEEQDRHRVVVAIVGDDLGFHVVDAAEHVFGQFNVYAAGPEAVFAVGNKMELGNIGMPFLRPVSLFQGSFAFVSIFAPIIPDDLFVVLVLLIMGAAGRDLVGCVQLLAGDGVFQAGDAHLVDFIRSCAGCHRQQAQDQDEADDQTEYTLHIHDLLCMYSLLSNLPV